MKKIMFFSVFLANCLYAMDEVEDSDLKQYVRLKKGYVEGYRCVSFNYRSFFRNNALRYDSTDQYSIICYPDNILEHPGYPCMEKYKAHVNFKTLPIPHKIIDRHNLLHVDDNQFAVRDTEGGVWVYKADFDKLQQLILLYKINISRYKNVIGEELLLDSNRNILAKNGYSFSFQWHHPTVLEAVQSRFRSRIKSGAKRGNDGKKS